MLNKHDLPLVKEETDRVDTLHYSWQKLNVQASQVSSHLISVQPTFKEELVTNVKIFVKDCDDFYSDYNTVRHLATNLYFLLKQCLNACFLCKSLHYAI